MILKSRTLLLLLIEVFRVIAQDTEQSCISLADTKMCPEYKSYSIISFPGVGNSGQFDSYVQSQAAFNFPGCQGWTTAGNTSIKYSHTFVCGWAIYYSTTLAAQNSTGLSCNKDGTPPSNICKSSATTAAADVSANLLKFCPTETIFNQYANFVGAIADTDCLLGIGSDVSLKCGFPAAAEAELYCNSNSGAKCCTSTINLVSENATQATTTESSAATSTVGLPDFDPSKASPTSTAAASASSSTIISPLLIGAAALGVALVAVLGSVLYFMTKRSKRASVAASRSKKTQSFYNTKKGYGNEPAETSAGRGVSMAPTEGGDTMECVFEYKANLFDELTLEVGDEVQVITKFDDGWALGHNLSSGKEGTFPLACLAPFGTGSEYRDSRFESTYSKRDSSIRYTVDSSAFTRPY